jgi:very-short-patch-repair endonuclease
MSRGADERSGRPRAGPAPVLRLAWPEVSLGSSPGQGELTTTARAARHDTPRPRTDREREANRRLERAEEVRAAWRVARPTAPEQQMMSVLATLGERYGEDYLREHKIMDGGWYVTHVDFAWPATGRVIEVYGGPHYKPALDRTGTRQEDDRQRVAEITAAGWAVLVVEDTALTQARWAATVEAVRTFLDRGRVPAQRRGR